jgi:hypothetical protein
MKRANEAGLNWQVSALAKEDFRRRPAQKRAERSPGV